MRRLKSLKYWGDNCIEIHHIGSTAVVDLSAKPTIDIMPVVRNLADVDSHASDFEDIGYEYLGSYGINGRRYLRKVVGENDLCHIHIFGEASRSDIERHLAVRDYLRTHKAVADEYGRLKTELAARFPYDNDGYCDGKEAFMKKLEQAALSHSAQ